MEGGGGRCLCIPRGWTLRFVGEWNRSGIVFEERDPFSLGTTLDSGSTQRSDFYSLRSIPLCHCPWRSGALMTRNLFVLEEAAAKPYSYATM